MILHDAARDDLSPIMNQQEESYWMKLIRKKMETVCSYFGAIHAGRGVEVIHAMANLRPETIILVYGGTRDE